MPVLDVPEPQVQEPTVQDPELQEPPVQEPQVQQEDVQPQDVQVVDDEEDEPARSVPASSEEDDREVERAAARERERTDTYEEGAALPKNKGVGKKSGRGTVKEKEKDSFEEGESGEKEKGVGKGSSGSMKGLRKATEGRARASLSDLWRRREAVSAKQPSRCVHIKLHIKDKVEDNYENCSAL